jgi:hypothetical protein
MKYFNIIDQLKGWCSQDKSEKLYKLIIDQKPLNIVEIGVFAGKSLFSQAFALKENNLGIIHGIDSWKSIDCVAGMKDESAINWWSSLDYENLYKELIDNIQINDLQNFIKIHRMSSEEFSKTIDFEIDILHIDGNHEEENACRDIEMYLPKVKEGGYVWFDDANWHQTQKAVKLIENKFNFMLINKAKSDDPNNFCNLYIKKTKTIIPKIFCLTLKSTPKRKEYAQQHFSQHYLDIEFFEGIHGKKFGLETKIPYMDDQPNWTPDHGPMHFISSGHIGCILSHYMLWKVLSYLPYEEIIIFEDDVVLTDRFIENFIKYKNQLPDDWQYVFLGHCCLPSEEYQIKISDNIINTIHPPMCTHAYMIKKSAIPILLETNSLAWSHIDIQIQKRSLKYLKHYVFIPPIVDQISINNPKDPNFKSLTVFS